MQYNEARWYLKEIFISSPTFRHSLENGLALQVRSQSLSPASQELCPPWVPCSSLAPPHTRHPDPGPLLSDYPLASATAFMGSLPSPAGWPLTAAPKRPPCFQDSYPFLSIPSRQPELDLESQIWPSTPPCLFPRAPGTKSTTYTDTQAPPSVSLPPPHFLLSPPPH